MSRKIWIALLIVMFACSRSPERYIKKAERYGRKYGLVYWKKSEKYFDLALAHGAKLSDISENYKNLLVNITTMYLYYQKYDVADSYLKKVERYFSTDYDVKLLRAIYFIRQRKFDMGRRILESLEMQGHRSADILYAYATMYFLQKNYQRAIDYLEQIKDEYEGKTELREVLYMLGYSYYMIKEYYNALRAYNKLLDLETSYYRKARVAQNIATVYIALGDEESAQKYAAMSDEFIKKLRTENPRKKWKKRK